MKRANHFLGSNSLPDPELDHVAFAVEIHAPVASFLHHADLSYELYADIGLGYAPIRSKLVCRSMQIIV